MRKFLIILLLLAFFGSFFGLITTVSIVGIPKIIFWLFLVVCLCAVSALLVSIHLLGESCRNRDLLNEMTCSGALQNHVQHIAEQVCIEEEKLRQCKQADYSSREEQEQAIAHQQDKLEKVETKYHSLCNVLHKKGYDVPAEPTVASGNGWNLAIST